MIVTVTMNPAIDKTVEIGTLVPGGLNRIQKVEYDAGGKGINVSKTIRELGGSSIATGFLGGNAGKTIENVLRDREIEHDFIWVEGETRTNTKVFEASGEVTELNEPGPSIGEEQLDALMKKLESYAGPETLFVLAGSIPNGVDKQIYARIIRLVHEKGAKVLLDADGELFRNSLDAGPDIIKPNRVELEDYEAKCPALTVKAHSTVGAGDAMVAALAYSWDKKLDHEETIRLAIATSAGAVTTIGTKPPTRELVDTLKEQVIIERIGE